MTAGKPDMSRVFFRFVKTDLFIMYNLILTMILAK
ncbi:hypothetical protein SB6415_04758 [Klebsiella pasteurii]|nr:hypothetical protein SB6415_04758 [Klebsiella pasteurii]